MCNDTYSSNVVALVGVTMWMTAAMSNTRTVACSTECARPVDALMHLRMSDLVPPLSEPRSDRAGGSFWFSYLKNSATSASGRDCRERRVV